MKKPTKLEREPAANLAVAARERTSARIDVYNLRAEVTNATNALEALRSGPPERHRLPDERQSVTHHFVIHSLRGGAACDYDGYIIAGLYPDGRVGELFVKLDRQGSSASGFVDAWAISVSLLLQTGTPLATLCAKFRGARFDPGGKTDNQAIPFCSSPIDYVARWLEAKFVGGTK